MSVAVPGIDEAFDEVTSDNPQDVSKEDVPDEALFLSRDLSEREEVVKTFWWVHAGKLSVITEDLNKTMGSMIIGHGKEAEVYSAKPGTVGTFGFKMSF